MKTTKLSLSESDIRSLLTALDSADSFMFFETTKPTPENHRTLLFLKPLERLICTAGDDPVAFLHRAEQYLKKGLHLAGWVAYEFGYLLEPVLAASFTARSSSPLADLCVFEEPYVFDHDAGGFSEKGPWPTVDRPENDQQGAVRNMRLSLEREGYIEAVQAIKAYIEAGDTYQVNYTLKLLFEYSGRPSSLYTSLRRNQSVSYAAYLKNREQRILSFSPELFFHKKAGHLIVRPMKGTMPRGCTLAEDRQMARFLQQDIKNRSENVMIVDLLRNDLGRLSRMGGVQVQSLFDVETYETLHQMTSTISGELPSGDGTFLVDLFQALFPSGSVTGAPKIRTMEIIRELESEDRGVYTGGIGFIAPDGEAMFNVPIRTVLLSKGRGEMGIGSGIVYDSDPVSEWEECRLKGRFLTNSVPEFGLLETILWQADRGFWLLDRHLDRLEESAQYFDFSCNRKEIAETLQKLSANFQGSAVRLRLLMNKRGEVEITNTPCSPPGLIMEEGAGFPAVAAADLPRVVFSAERISSRSVYQYHKTTLRQLYDRERQQAVREGYYEVLFVNEREEIAEGSITNIFMQKGDALLTPPVDSGLLPGVFRRYLLENSGLNVREAVLSRKDLEEADAVYVGNSVRGLVRVSLETKVKPR